MSLDQICQTIQIDSDALAPCIAELLVSNQIEMAVTPDGFGVYYYPMATAGSPPPAPRLASSCS
jgi:hypothetical protein